MLLKSKSKEESITTNLCENVKISRIAKQLLLHSHLMSTTIQNLVKIEGVGNKVLSCLPTK